jgi:hypothetical protein
MSATVCRPNLYIHIYIYIYITVVTVYSIASSGEARGFKVGGLRGRVREGVYPPPAGGPGAVPPQKFSNYRCT